MAGGCKPDKSKKKLASSRELTLGPSHSTALDRNSARSWGSPTDPSVTSAPTAFAAPAPVGARRRKSLPAAGGLVSTIVTTCSRFDWPVVVESMVFTPTGPGRIYRGCLGDSKGSGR